MSLFKNCLKPFSTFFPLPGYKTPYDHLKSGLNRHIFFSMGYKLEPYESWFVGMSDSFHLSDFSFVQFRKYLFRNIPSWHCEIITHLMNLFLDYERDELIIVTSTGTKKQKWNCQKGWKITPSLLTYNKWLIF